MEHIVYVLSKDGSPLMPTKRYGKVRRLLKAGLAKAVTAKPFTIKLLYDPAETAKQPVTLGINPGRNTISMAAARNDGKCLYAAQCATKNAEIVKLMDKRRMFRRASRRGERLVRKRLARRLGTTAKKLLNRILPGCKKPVAVKDIINTESRFNNRKRPKGWLTPTATQLLRTHLNLIHKVQKILPVTDVTLKVNRIAFMLLDTPGLKKYDIDFHHGPLSGYKNMDEVIHDQQKGKCLLCGKEGIDCYHHIIPLSMNGSDTVDNIAGLHNACHDLVHKDPDARERLRDKKAGLNKKYGSASVLNQILPSLAGKLTDMFPDHFSITNAWTTKAMRERYGLMKDHFADAYCIACCMSDPGAIRFIPPASYFKIRQFRRHDRANIHCQRQRAYYLDGKKVAVNRKKAILADPKGKKDIKQAEDSLEEWFAKMVTLHGCREAERMRSRLTVKKSRRHYNDRSRLLPGAIIRYQGKILLVSGQRTSGKYYLSQELPGINIPASKVKILCKNTGLVYVP